MHHKTMDDLNVKNRDEKLVFLTKYSKSVGSRGEACDLLSQFRKEMKNTDYVHDTVLLQCLVNACVSTLCSELCDVTVFSSFLEEEVKFVVSDSHLNGVPIWCCLEFFTGVVSFEIAEGDVQIESKRNRAVHVLVESWCEVMDAVRKGYEFSPGWESQRSAIVMTNLWIKLIKMDQMLLKVIGLEVGDFNLTWLLKMLSLSGQREAHLLHNRVFVLLARLTFLAISDSKTFDLILDALFSDIGLLYCRSTCISVGGVVDGWPKGDRPVLRSFVLVVLKCIEKCSNPRRHFPKLEQVRTSLRAIMELDETNLRDALFLLFLDQDDDLSSMLLLTLNIHSILSNDGEVSKSVCAEIEPIDYFAKFLEHIHSDAGVLLDLMTSPETFFLQYFLLMTKIILRYIKDRINLEKSTLVPYDDSEDEESAISTRGEDDLYISIIVLRSMKSKLERLSTSGILQFNPAPLLRNITAIEIAWEMKRS